MSEVMKFYSILITGVAALYIFMFWSLISAPKIDFELDANLKEAIRQGCKSTAIREVSKPCPTTTKEYVEITLEEPIYITDNTCPMKLTACDQRIERLKVEKEQCLTELADEKGAFLLLLNKCQ